ncbi:hypothetical protein U1Q18_024195 [Sarracenia purpurea var. burkii]
METNKGQEGSMVASYGVIAEYGNFSLIYLRYSIFLPLFRSLICIRSVAMAGPTIGIDLEMTPSRVRVWEHGCVQVVANDRGNGAQSSQTGNFFISWSAAVELPDLQLAALISGFSRAQGPRAILQSRSGVLHHARKHRVSAILPSSSWDMGFDYSPDDHITSLL